jgi:hypothetical protein
MKLNIAGPRSLKDPSSVDYAWQTVHYLRTLYQSRESSDKKFEEILEQAKAARIWERIPEENPYGSLDSMLVAEIGDTEAVAVEKVRLGQHGGDHTSKQEPEQAHNIRLLHYGTHTNYLRARLKRDHEEILARLDAGEFKSTYQAALEAGIVRKPTALEILKRTWKKTTQAEQTEFLAWISESHKLA